MGLTQWLNLRIRDEEKAYLERAAAAKHETVSTLVRRASMAEARRILEPA